MPTSFPYPPNNRVALAIDALSSAKQRGDKTKARHLFTKALFWFFTIVAALFLRWLSSPTPPLVSASACVYLIVNLAVEKNRVSAVELMASSNSSLTWLVSGCTYIVPEFCADIVCKLMVWFWYIAFCTIILTIVLQISSTKTLASFTRPRREAWDRGY